MAPTINPLLLPRAAEANAILNPKPPARNSASSIPPSAPPLVNDFASRSLITPPFPVRLVARQQTSTIPSYYGGTNGLDPGAVAGIVLGSVVGFCLLLWLIYTCINIGNTDSRTETASVVTRSTAHRSAAAAKRHSHRRSRGEEVVEVRRTTSTTQRGPVIVEEVGGGERIVVEERRRSFSRGPPPPRMVPRGPRSDFTTDDEDEVVVIEEHSRSPPPQRRRSRIRSVERRSSGFREVDPDRFAGGNGSVIEVRRSSSRRR